VWHGSVGHECRTKNMANPIFHGPPVLQKSGGEFNASCSQVPTVGIRKRSTLAGKSRQMGALSHIMLANFSTCELVILELM
jgi:hypothetical protein